MLPYFTLFAKKSVLLYNTRENLNNTRLLPILKKKQKSLNTSGTEYVHILLRFVSLFQSL